MTIEAVIELIEIGAIAPQDIVKCLRSALDSNKPQRTWVELTNEERFEVADHSDCFEDVVDATEAKLKEKNT